MEFAPIVVFAYNRADKIKKCLESLMQCKGASDSDVIVYSDGYKDDRDKNGVLQVRDLLRLYKCDNSFKSYKVIEQSVNKGLAMSIIMGVSKEIKTNGKIIVVEDDLQFSSDFIEYMNEALEYYKNHKRYGCVSSYTMPLECLRKYEKDVYAARKGDCWGWATWIDRWENVDWELNDFNSYLKDKKRRKQFAHLELGLEEQLIDQYNGKLDAWAARWLFHLFNNDLLTIYPRECRTVNIGFDNDGTNCGKTSKYDNCLCKCEQKCIFELVDVDLQIEKAIYKYGGNIIIYKIKGFIWKTIHKVRNFNA